MADKRRAGLWTAARIWLAFSVAIGGCEHIIGADWNSYKLPETTDGGVDTTCVGDPTRAPELVTDRCGIFVSASAAAGGDGTRTKPLQRLSEAAEKNAERVYACAEDYAETAGVHFTQGVEIFAGFTDCDSGWRWSDNARGKLLGPVDAIPLILEGGRASDREP